MFFLEGQSHSLSLTTGWKPFQCTGPIPPSIYTVLSSTKLSSSFNTCEAIPQQPSFWAKSLSVCKTQMPGNSGVGESRRCLTHRICAEQWVTQSEEILIWTTGSKFPAIPLEWPRLNLHLGPKGSSKMDKRSKLVPGTDKRLHENGDHQFAKAIFLMKHR